ncbi:MAG: transposase [Patescibacteria group bacterium]
MPAKNRIKVYIENGHYHVYNRGIEKRDIFLDDQDYRVFLHFLKFYLSPPKTNFTHPLGEITGFKPTRIRDFSSSLSQELQLLAYCLMPNHFHLLLTQKTSNGMTKLLRRLLTNYAMYFNRKYKRNGYLFQGNYKAVLVLEEPYLLHLSRYLHLNPAELTGTDPVNWPYSSYPYYLGKKKAIWINPEPILSFFKTARRTSLKDILSYQSFIEDYQEDPREMLGNLIIEG